MAAVDAQEDGFKGRTLLQKKMYFLSVLTGEDFGFSPYYYGPFSSEVADHLGALCDVALIAERSESYPDLVGPFGELRRYDYQITDPGGQVVHNRADAVQRYERALAKINSHSIADEAKLLSTAAKVHLIVNERGKSTAGDIRTRAQELGWEITNPHISQVVDYLEHLGLVRTGG